MIHALLNSVLFACQIFNIALGVTNDKGSITIAISGTITPSSPLHPPTLYTAAAATLPGNCFFLIGPDF